MLIQQGFQKSRAFALTTKPVGKGTELGLFVSYQIIVEKHKGKISCFSTPGKGTEFIVKMPLSLVD
ncbi:hypothetical protein I8751_25100 [Nostocaceae cyanobacterium CENA357]|uniref:Histidine kinase/HSP90-like ATPase domain-containing protein n=1 Tax=Atlanticothrix silvestris CENA357 TaxID=1725252 RepID=A0A8J7HMA6_9CYAN|nr:hypothetical protein [Atlanticothrix silvestris CENA357]